MGAGALVHLTDDGGGGLYIVGVVICSDVAIDEAVMSIANTFGKEPLTAQASMCL